MRILTIIGARPQFIKAAAVSRVIRSHNDIREIIAHTGQHFDANMSDVFFEQMDIPRPNHYLKIANLSHGAMTGRMLEGIEELIQQEKPDWVMVYADTNSTLASALAAAKSHLPIAHVEQDCAHTTRPCLKKLIGYLQIEFLPYFYVRPRPQ